MVGMKGGEEFKAKTRIGVSMSAFLDSFRRLSTPPLCRRGVLHYFSSFALCSMPQFEDPGIHPRDWPNREAINRRHMLSDKARGLHEMDSPSPVASVWRFPWLQAVEVGQAQSRAGGRCARACQMVRAMGSPGFQSGRLQTADSSGVAGVRR